MINTDFFHDETPQKKTLGLGGIEPIVLLNLLKKNWYWYVISVLLGFLGAKYYIDHTLVVYRTRATILINESENRPLVDNTALLQGLGLPGGMQNLENQIMILRSRDLTERTLQDLPFEIEFYFKTFRNKLPIYPDLPLKISYNGEVPLPRNTEFMIRYLGDDSFNIISQAEHFPFNVTARFGDTIQAGSGSFWVDCNNANWLMRNQDRKICFIINSRNSLVNSFIGRMNVELLSRGGSILEVSMVGTNPARDADFLNRHLQGFQYISLDKKNIEADRRIQFIDDQLVGISDSLSTTEDRLQQFRSSHQVMDLSAQGQALIGQVTLLENERARLNLEANYYDYLAEYLSKEVSGEMPIIPITMGINDPGLTRLVQELAELQSQLATRGAGEMNPLQRNLEQRIRSSKEALRETLNGLRRANSLARSENQEQISRVNSRASALPVTERQLLGIERRFKLNDELNTFLLETRAEQQMQKASNRSDSEIIDKADPRFSSRISPNKSRIQFVGLLAGVGIPSVVLFLIFLFNNTVKEEDVRRITNLPVLGHIPHNSSDSNTIVFEQPNSAIAESFRLLRSKMQFILKEAKAPVILVTSALPADGKTFTAMNLASVYSMLGKKTVLVGFDLRKPKIYHDFKLDNEKGVSTWLIGKNNLKEIIQKTSFDNLSIISSGPVPPNPSELTALEKTRELIHALKNEFDYVVIDASPIGLVSDTFYLTPLADAILMIIRSDKTLRNIFEKTIAEISNSNVKGISLVINDISLKKTHYGYGERYGYTDEASKRFKLFPGKRKK